MEYQIRNVPFFRPSIADAEIDAVVRCLKSGWLTTGPETGLFEDEFSALMGKKTHAVAVNSATAALHLGLEAMGVGAGDEVLLPTLTFTATAEVVSYVGATPVFVDIDPTTLSICTERLGDAITNRTRVILPVHMCGHPCDMRTIRGLADRHGLFVLDDAAHALPTYYEGSLIGGDHSLADATAFSFYANKTMTTGEGGMLTTCSSKIAQRVKKMRLHGIDRDVFDRFTSISAGWAYDVIAAGYKYNLTDLASAIGRVQLGKLSEFSAKRKDIRLRYDEAFKNLPLVLPTRLSTQYESSNHLYVVQLPENLGLSRDEFIEKLREAGVGTSVHYRPLHQMTHWSKYARSLEFPSADNYFRRCVSLPLFMDMTNDEIEYVIDVVSSTLTDYL